MITLMVKQNTSNITHKILDENTRFSDFHNLVCHENFGKQHKPNQNKNSVYIPATDTMYIMLKVQCLIAD